ncbi:MAG: cellulase family glycosylhydrolase [Spirochaetia bacterium]|jgi:aryl-phospho-beta-D-glucosidase BglC (GH1 family)
MHFAEVKKRCYPLHVKIIGTHGLTIMAILVSVSATLRAQAVSTTGPALDHVPTERLALLARGINLNNWFTPWANPAAYGSRFRPEEAAFLKRAGFTVCRLPLDPDLLFDPANPAQLNESVRFVDRGVRVLLDAGLAVVLDPIHGSSSTAEWERRLDHDPSFLGKVEIYWESLARHYAAFSHDRIFFEIMNEPHLSASERVDPSWWMPVQQSLAAAIRRGAASNTIIATGESWGGIDGLLALKPLPDRNVIYSFHWYEPFAFTHQGAAWAGPVQAELAGIRYPSSPAAVAAQAAAFSDPKARAGVLSYGIESWNEPRVRQGLARAAAWAAANHVPVFCGEFGVYRKVAPPADRLRWIGDVRRSLESLDIGWSMWDYETDFGLVTYSEPGWRRGVQVDAGCLAALGLDAAQTLEAPPGEATLAAFASGAVQAIDIPIEDWTRLWTRDPGAGGSSTENDPNGSPAFLALTHRGSRDWALGSDLRVPVTAGENLELSSGASLQGAGSLSMEFVARDASGTVLDWSYGRVRVSPGAERAIATEVNVSRGIASLEPRWSGSGPIVARLRAFRLRRGLVPARP